MQEDIANQEQFGSTRVVLGEGFIKTLWLKETKNKEKNEIQQNEKNNENYLFHMIFESLQSISKPEVRDHIIPVTIQFFEYDCICDWK